jgi:type IV secretion system protein VirB2
MGIIVAGATLVWGGEINEFVRRLVMLILVLSLLAASTTILKDLMGMSAAVI